MSQEEKNAKVRDHFIHDPTRGIGASLAGTSGKSQFAGNDGDIPTNAGDRLGLGIAADPDGDKQKQEFRGKGKITGYTVIEKQGIAEVLNAFKQWWSATPGSRQETRAALALVDIIEQGAQMFAEDQ
jgi:hypothetical protein